MIVSSVHTENYPTEKQNVPQREIILTFIYSFIPHVHIPEQLSSPLVFSGFMLLDL